MPHRPKKTVAVVAALALVASAFSAAPVGASPLAVQVRATALTCAQTGLPQYMVLDSRGSGEAFPPTKDTSAKDAKLHPWPGGAANDSLHWASPPTQGFVEELQKLEPNDVISVIANPYPAASVAGWPTSINGVGSIANGVGAILHIGVLGAYHASVKEGTGWIGHEVAHEMATCPRTRFFLTGYSQGAQATADFWQRNATKTERAVIDGVVLFGDPYFNPSDSAVDRGTATAVPDGFHGLLGQRPKFGPNSKDKVLSYCELWDPICDADPNKEAWVAQLALFHKVHTTAYPPDGKKAALALVHPTTIAAHAAADGCYFSQAVASAIVGVSMGPPQPMPVTPPGSGDPICYYQELGGRVTLNITPEDQATCSPQAREPVVPVPGGGCVIEVNIGSPQEDAEDPVDKGPEGGGVGEVLSIFETNAPAGAYSPSVYSELLIAAESLVKLLLKTGGRG